MKKTQFDHLPYDIHFKLSLILTLSGFVLMVMFGPVMYKNRSNTVFVYSELPITIDLIEITTQLAPPVSPPRPRVPVQVLLDPIVQERDLDLLIEIPVNLENAIAGAFETGQRVLVRNPQRQPRVQRIVEPVSPDVTTRIEIVALLTVGVDGRVESVEIQSIKKFNPVSGVFEFAVHIDPAYIEATQYAAMQWIFRPAAENGNPVRSVSEHVFTFGRGIN
jgi:hypothetical protein